MYVFGGVDRGQVRFNDVFEYSFKLKEWRRIIAGGEIPSPRTFHRAICYKAEMYIFGGYDSQRKNDLYALNLQLS